MKVRNYSGFPPAKAEGEPEPVWLARLSGDAQQYAQPPPKEGTTSYATNVLYSLRWPGAYVLHQVGTMQNGRWANIYIGNGIKVGGDSFYPIQPGLVGDDPEDGNEMPEPNPKDAPQELESDSDAGKEGAEGEESGEDED